MPNRLRDPVTGLWDDAFFHASVRTRLAVARRELRPMAIVLLGLGDADGTLDPADATAREAAYAFLRTLRECDQASRLDDGAFGIVLEATDERGAVLCVDRLRALLADGGNRHVVWAGIAAYPTHSLDAGNLVLASRVALCDARRWATSRIEVAVLP